MPLRLAINGVRRGGPPLRRHSYGASATVAAQGVLPYEESREAGARLCAKGRARAFSQAC